MCPCIHEYIFHGKRRLQVIHTRIRTKCSSLSQHLYSKGIVESPLCVCGSVESAEHYFLNCFRYDAIRMEMMRSIENIARFCLNTIMFGDKTKNYQINMSIFDAVHRYIEDSKRFD